MRSHGVPNFPDPNSRANFLYQRGEINGQKVDYNSPQFTSANKVCTHLLPNGGKATAAELQQALTQTLKYVQCLRQHGLPNMADPVESDGHIRLSFRQTGLGPTRHSCRRP